MRIRPEAQAILDRALPDRLDSLWCEILASPYGFALLDAWDLDLEQVRVAAPVLSCRFPDILHRASLHSLVNSMICAAEWVAEDLLTGHRDWQGPPLAHFTAGNIEYHEVDIRDAYALAFDEGMEEALERHYLQVARDVWPVMDRILEFSSRPIASFSGIYHPTSRNGPIDAAQLASACLREPQLSAWMESLGICSWRLHNNLLETGLRTQVSYEKLRWMKPACEEARFLGSTLVTPDHLLLALLGELHGVTLRVLRDSAVDVRALRRRLTSARSAPVTASQMAFDSGLLSIVQQASEADGKDPYSGVLFKCLLDRVEFPEIPADRVLPALQRMLTGSLPDNLESLSIDGLRLGMTEGEVLERLGRPSFRKELCWMYRDTSVNFENGVVHGVIGGRLEIDGLGESLDLGSPWEKAERILGALRLWYGSAGPVWALISGGKVRMLTLSLDDDGQDSLPE